MNGLLGRLLLRQKFIILAALAATMVALPSALYLFESNKAVAMALQEARGIAPARTVLRLIQLIQQHRGLLAMQLSGNAELKTEQLAKFDEAERAVANVELAVRRIDERGVSAAWVRAREDWSILSADVGQHTLEAEASFALHTALIARLLKLNLLVADQYKLRLDPEPDTYFLIDAALVRAPVLRETLGQIRGMGSGLLAEGAAGPEDRMVLNSRADRASDYYDSIDDDLGLAMNSNEALRYPLLELVQANRGAGGQVLRLAQEQIIRAGQISYPAPEYYRLFTETLDAQFRLSELVLDQLDALLNQRASHLIRTSYTLGGAILLLSALAVLFSRLIVRSVTGPLGAALGVARGLTTGAADKIAIAEAIASGDLSQEPATTPVPPIGPQDISSDEVGELLGSIVRMSEVQRSLDLAFGQMTRALRANHQAERARDWLKSGLNELGDLMRGEQDTGRMAEQVLGYLARRLEAQSGAFYLYDEAAGQLQLCASYAHTRRRDLADRYALGQGLVGQAARERRCICLSDVPPDYAGVVSSGLGAAAPNNVSAVPLLHGETLVGALELGAFHLFSDAELEFLERAREGIAIGFDANLSRQRMRAVLERRQRQPVGCVEE